MIGDRMIVRPLREVVSREGSRELFVFRLRWSPVSVGNHRSAGEACRSWHAAVSVQARGEKVRSLRGWSMVDDDPSPYKLAEERNGGVRNQGCNARGRDGGGEEL